jgi:hypothetical protein
MRVGLAGPDGGGGVVVVVDGEVVVVVVVDVVVVDVVVEPVVVVVVVAASRLVVVPVVLVVSCARPSPTEKIKVPAVATATRRAVVLTHEDEMIMNIVSTVAAKN